jgi:hypothetical protein
MTTKTFIKGLYLARFIASTAIVCVVVAGALGFDDAIKVWVAAGGATLAVSLKVLHVVA